MAALERNGGGHNYHDTATPLLWAEQEAVRHGRSERPVVILASDYKDAGRQQKVHSVLCR